MWRSSSWSSALGYRPRLHSLVGHLCLAARPLRQLCIAFAARLTAGLAQKVACCAVIIFFAGFVCAGQEPKSNSIAGTIKGEPPAVTMDARGCPVLKLTDQQRTAVGKFKQAHPLVEIYDYSPSEYSDGSCLDTYQQWRMSASEGKAIAQYPFAVWGDFNHDGFLDFTVFFVGNKPVVTHKWPMNGKFVYTYEYEWLVVVFQGSPDGTFSPVIAGRDRWARAMDGVVFDLGHNRIEYWLKTASGSVQWTGTGTGYRITPMKSHD